METLDVLKIINYKINRRFASKEEAGKKIDISRQTLSNYLTGASNMPLGIFLKIADVLKIHPCACIVGRRKCGLLQQTPK